MNRLKLVVALCLASLMTGAAFAGDEKPTKLAEITIEGELLDLGCYTEREARGKEHQECAARCLKNGNPAGVITDDGAVYTIAATAPAFEPFAAQRVRITGSVRATMIRASAMSVWVDSKWQEVPLNQYGSPKAPAEKG